MGKNSISRRSAIVQDNKGIGTLNEEHIIFDNNPMPSADDLAKYKNIDPKFVEYFIRITDEERAMRHKVTNERMELLSQERKHRHSERRLGLIFAFIALLGFLGITFYALYTDKSWLAGIFSVLSVGGVISAFTSSGHKSN